MFRAFSYLRFAYRHSHAWQLLFLSICVLLSACSTDARNLQPDVDLVDPDATPETRLLYFNLKQLAPGHLLFGHQDDLAYGVTWKREAGRSDVKDVTGAYPAVYGWELGDLELGASENLDGVNFEEMKQWIREGYERGGVITLSWHMDNPASKGSSWDTTRAVHTILPGGEHHEMYKTWLNRFADFARDLVTGPADSQDNGTPVPVIFRPFHEHTGSWFWWGGKNVTPEEYVQLWRFTVDYLRDEMDLHNLIYAYSTDVFETEADYLKHYPGDDYVDLLGYDDYQALRSDEGVADMTRRLRTLVQLAESRGKIAALTETGANRIEEPTWWTNRLLKAIKSDSLSQRIVYALVWRNADERQYFAPYAGHTSAPDFVEFYQDPFVLFGDELPELYE